MRLAPRRAMCFSQAQAQAPGSLCCKSLLSGEDGRGRRHWQGTKHGGPRELQVTCRKGRSWPRWQWQALKKLAELSAEDAEISNGAGN